MPGTGSNIESLQAEISRLRMEMQALHTKQGADTVRIGDYLLTRLAQLGVRHMFGVPGDFNLGFLDLVEDHRLMEWVGNCNELNAAYAADGYARAKSTIGVVLTTFGVGELSATNGIAGAFSEMVPVLHIVGVPSTTQQKKRPLLHHTLGDGRFDAFSKAAGQFTCYQTMINDPNTAASEIDRALSECITKNRPVYLMLPTDMVSFEITSNRLHTPLTRRETLNESQVEEFVLDLIELRVKEAEADVAVLVDACVMRYGIRKEVMEFLKETGFPVFAAPMGKTAVDENWKRYGGIYVGSVTPPEVKEQVEKAKLILSIGSLQTDFNSGNFTYNIPTRRLIELHSSYTQVQYAVFPNIGFKELLPKLKDRLQQFYPIANKIPVTPFANRLPQEATQSITQAYFWPRMGHFFKSGDIIVTETGTANFGIMDVPLPPKSHLLSQIFWGSIGWSVGAALGAAVAAREMKSAGRVILFVGDGSLQLTVQELSPMIRLGLKPIIFVLNNHGYVIERMIHGKHRKYNDIADWKWSQLLDVLGDRQTETASHTLTNKQDLDRLLNEDSFMNPDKITLIEVLMDRLDAPRILKLQTELSSKQNIYAPAKLGTVNSPV
ncbi:pyruvate decarboxylase [Coprinopsis cinerea okayama7|uniref:Pyruvate decarboxylase n=1 Tax=Coprinopsis cinerea (strain Okayama-7 / 130 / ATCC MYA-4618 / FGSC 9003) TaxID=240176 RepID=A8NQS7_COPC7|nr:pyruvate decarboxylase [Coprinopsis cinerea okayama7\|eukprot:XP_001835671.1 pyruvate decarboxylase [Coprinopsis cinerea okayama7\